MQSFDPSTGVTTVIGSLPRPQSDLAAATVGGRPVLLGGDVYLFGGLLGGGEYTGTFIPLIQQVDPATGTARIAGWLPYPVAHAKAVVLRGHILILGGRHRAGRLSAAGPLDQIVVITLRSATLARSAGQP